MGWVGEVVAAAMSEMSNLVTLENKARRVDERVLTSSRKGRKDDGRTSRTQLERGCPDSGSYPGARQKKSRCDGEHCGGREGTRVRRGGSRNDAVGRGRCLTRVQSKPRCFLMRRGARRRLLMLMPSRRVRICGQMGATFPSLDSCVRRDEQNGPVSAAPP